MLFALLLGREGVVLLGREGGGRRRREGSLSFIQGSRLVL
jgi:hypothetical protein